MINNILERVNLGNIWIFVTDKCNLDCDYCFFKYKEKKKTIEFSDVLSLLDKLPQTGKHDFILSGGEPLICWDLSKKIIEHLRANYPYSNITLQSNMLLFNDAMAKVFQKNDVVIEPGIDGGFLSNFRHRKGTDRKKFERLLKSIKLAVTYNLRIGPTMTVHPNEVKNIFENFSRLVSLGLNSIEVHPAFLAPWTENASVEFIRQYKKIINYEEETGKQSICKEYSVPMRAQQLDLVVQPDGLILPNWIYLSFSPKIKNKYFIMRIARSGIDIFSSQLLRYLKRLKEFDDGAKTYRDFSNFNAAYVLEGIKDCELKEGFLAYKNLCQSIQEIDQAYCARKGRVNGRSL